MPVRILAALIAVALVLAYVGPMVWRLKDPALAIVILIGTVVMLADLWQSLRDSQE